MDLLFSDRFWPVKVACAAGLLAWMGHRAAREVEAASPSIHRAADPDGRLVGKPFHFSAKRVEAVLPDGFLIQTRNGPCLVEARPPFPQEGEYVSAVGRFAGPGRVRADALQLQEGFRWKRPLVYAVSIATLAGFLWAVRRRFRWRLEEGAFRSRY